MSHTTAPRTVEADSGMHEGAIFVDRRALAFNERALCGALNALWKENSTGVRAAGAKFLTAQQQVILTLSVGDQTEHRTLGAAELADRASEETTRAVRRARERKARRLRADLAAAERDRRAAMPRPPRRRRRSGSM